MRAKVLRRYVNDGMSVEEIAELYDLEEHDVVNYLTRSNIDPAGVKDAG